MVNLDDENLVKILLKTKNSKKLIIYKMTFFILVIDYQNYNWGIWCLQSILFKNLKYLLFK